MSLYGVFGGTFDPVHNGHLRCAWEVSEQLEMPIHMIPCYQPVHRGHPGATPEQRLAMLELALEGQSRLIADGRELDRGGDSFMIDTLQSMRSEAPDNTPCLILGADAFRSIETWRSWQHLFEQAHFVVMTRAGESGSLHRSLENWISNRQVSHVSALEKSDFGKVLMTRVSGLEISASLIRARLANGDEPRFLLPAAVADYISEQNLYRS